jgi:predicted nucleotidyltransferase
MDKKRAYQIAKKYADFIKRDNSGIQKIYLFGSNVRGTAREDSDIDIAIVFDNFKNSFDIQVELMKLRRKFDTRLEPHPFRTADFNMSNPFAHEIITFGIEIK